MTVHVLHAGDGYTYLTRQVASGDVLRARGESLADYYTATGAPPGVWMGSGLAQLGVSGEVSEAQMRALFGQGLHPDAGRLVPERTALYVAAGETPQAAARAARADVRLGRAFPTFTPVTPSWREQLVAAYAVRATELGLSSPIGLSGTDRDQVRSDLGRRTFTDTYGRAPAGESELRAWVAGQSRPARQPVAGYDLVFTPVKSVSVLWGLGDLATSRAVLDAHHAAVARALAYVEAHGALTRTGAGGIAQVDTHGLVVAAFDHHDSRAGDPNLHTHCAVSTKVRGRDGKWRSLDGRVLFALAVSASETYNTAIEDELRTRLGVRFADRTTTGQTVAANTSRLRTVREVVGVDPRLLTRFASRRAAVETDYQARLAAYRDRWGHQPTRAVQMKLAQEATLATRGPKGAPKSLHAHRDEWMTQARHALGGASEQQVRATVAATTHRPPAAEPPLVVEDAARRVVAQVQEHRATWTVWHLRAEAERHLRSVPVPPGQDRAQLVDAVVAAALDASVHLSVPPAEAARPQALTRADGESVFAVHGADRYTSTAVLDAEDRLVAAARAPAVPPITRAAVDEAVTGLGLVGGQADLARAFATAPRLLVAGIGPAGSGKTTAMRALVRAAGRDRVRVIGLAPSAKAAQVLSEEVGVPAQTIHKLLHDLDTDPDNLDVRAGDVLVVDEAGMAGTLPLARLVDLAQQRGAVLRLLGDPSQLAAIESGGALRLIDADVGAVHLDVVHRFTDPAEATATSALRAGDPAALAFYEQAGRVHDGPGDQVAEHAYRAWRADTTGGRASILLAATTDQVRALSARARLDRIADGAVDPTRHVTLHDGGHASPGDVIITRRNDRTLSAHAGRDFVKNGDLWRVNAVRDDGSLDVSHTRHRGRAHLPAAYVSADVELGYALTIHRAQGVTVDTAHLLVDDTTTRQALYVGATRGRAANHLYVTTSGAIALDVDRPPAPERDARDVLLEVLARDGAELSATQTRRDERSLASSLARLVPQYLHAHALHAETVHRLRDVVTAVLGPDVAADVIGSPGWPGLAAKLTAIADAGGDPRADLTQAAGRRDLESAESVADVLSWRLRAPVPAGTAGVAGLPAPPAGEGDLQRWLTQRAQRIGARVDQLAAANRRAPAPWTNRLGPRPHDPAQAADWDRTHRAVLAYRDQHDVTTPDDALGPRPQHFSQQQTWDRLAGDLRTHRTAAGNRAYDDGRERVRGPHL